MPKIIIWIKNLITSARKHIADSMRPHYWIEIALFIIAILAGAFVIFSETSALSEMTANLITDERFQKPSLVSMVIIIYVAVTWLLMLHVKPSVLDSYYYLGFLFTLITMVAIFGKYEPNDDNILDLISQNGVALLSTVVGMFARIVVRMSLIGKSHSNSEVQFNYPTREEIQTYISLMESMRDMSTSIKSVVELGKASGPATENLNILSSSVTNFSTQVSSAYDGLEEFSDSLEISKTLSGQVSKSLVDDIDTVRNSLIDEKKNLLKETTELFGSISQKVDGIDHDIQQLSDVHDMLLKLYSRLNESISKQIGR